MPQSSGFSSGKFALELQGKAAGFLQSCEGGEIFGSVVTEPPGKDGIARKHIGRVDFTPITITFGVGMAAELYKWISEMLERKQTPRDGAISFLSFDFAETQRLEWKNAVITSVVFPAADGASKEAALLTVTIAPDRTALKPGSGKRQPGFAPRPQKQWLASNFRFSITGLDQSALSRVRRIEAFSVTQSFADDERRGRLGLVQATNVVVTTALTFAQPWLDWIDDFLVKGNVGDDAERTATLQFLDSTLKNALFTVTLSHVGPVRARRQLAVAAVEAVAQLEVELYCESATLVTDDETTGGPNPA